jgi:hypothetical protein
MPVSFAPSCAGISKLERVRSSEITKDYQRCILAQRVPVAASIEFTMRCSLHSAHCYCPLGNRERELDTEEVKAVFDGLTSMGTFFLLMTGGDPLPREDFPELYRYAKQRGMLVSICTNGTLVTDDFPGILWTKRDQISKCGHCAHRSTCSNCPGVALWETRSSDSHVDFACHLSELRAKRYAGDAVETRGGRLPPRGERLWAGAG